MSKAVENKENVRMSRRYLTLIKLLNKRLNHFPAHERQGLALVIRKVAYSLCDHLVEVQKRGYKITHINNLDVAHEQMRMHIFTAYEQQYFSHPLPSDLDPAATKDELNKIKDDLNEKRFEALTIPVDEFGCMIGGWKNKIKADDRRRKAEAEAKALKSAENNESAT